MTDHIAPSHRAAQDFLAEAEDIADKLAVNLADLADSDDLNPDLLNSVFRGAHSMKGLAGIFGFTGITELSHHMESLLDWLRLGKVSLTKPVIGLLLESQALLKSLLRDISKSGQPAHTDEVAACIARIRDHLLPDAEDTFSSSLEHLGLSRQVLNSLTEYEQHRLRHNLEKGENLYSIHASYGLDSFEGDLSRLTDALKSGGEIISTLPGADDNNETRIGFDILYGSSWRPEDVKKLLDGADIQVLRLAASDSAAGSDIVRVTPRTVLTDSTPGTDDKGNAIGETSLYSSRDSALSTKSTSRTVRVDIGKLDELMNIAAELTLTHASIADIALRLSKQGFSRLSIDLAKASRLLERRLSALRTGVVEIRMIPLGQLYEKLSLIVRGISREQGKKVDLKLTGADTELDKLIMEELSDPMMHIIRNAIDHGIEASEQRLAYGKNENGVIAISARQKGNHVVITVEDDGNGIDLDKVRAAALHNGLVSQTDCISDREALEFIFLPGFSTTDAISEVSGRGVGMDVVRNNISAMSGRIDIETAKGTGTRFTITLPVTLAITKALILTCAGRTYALPIASVHESLLLTDRDVLCVESGEAIQLREKTLPILGLDVFFGLDRPGVRPEEYYVVVAGIGEVCLGIVVDDLLGQQDIVIKSLGDSFRGVQGVCGAADLGDLGTILVLDVGDMINEALRYR
ncbi:MAG: chemotaxis protein CheA [Desulfuromonadales bacterium]|nr:chemotaxis protein CheA [Desulfuromonadales bacterium]